MPHNYTTDQYEGMIAETITINGANGDAINTYFARPLGDGPFPAMVLIHHLPGWDELYRDFTRKFAHHGYLAISPDLYHRFGHGTPDDVASPRLALRAARQTTRWSPTCPQLPTTYARCRTPTARSASSAPAQVGRHAFLCACRSTSFDAAVECWGGRVVQAEDDRPPQQPVAPIDYTCRPVMPAAGAVRRGGREPDAGAGGPARGSAEGRRQGLRVPHVRGRRSRLLLLRPRRVPPGAGRGRLEQALRLHRQTPELTDGS